jgi:hypothetical protein
LWLFYDATDSQLANALAHLGVPARVVPQLQESLVVNTDGSGQYSFPSAHMDVTVR